MGHVKKFWKKAFVFSGRTTPREYWTPMSFYIIFSIVFSMIPKDMIAIFPRWLLLTLVLFVVVSLPSVISITVRRLHDIRKSRAYYFFNFIPVIGNLILLFYLVQSSDMIENKYGKNSQMK